MTTAIATKQVNHALENAKAHLESIIEWHTKSVLSVSNEEREEIEEEASESILSVDVRSNDWQAVGEELEATQGRLLLTTGGPACQIIFDLDEHQEFAGNVEIQYQDWGTPWTPYWSDNDDEQREALEWLACLFYYGTN